MGLLQRPQGRRIRRRARPRKRLYPEDFSRIEGLLVAQVKGKVQRGDKIHCEVDYFKSWANQICKGETVQLFRMEGTGDKRKIVPAGAATVFRVKNPAVQKNTHSIPDDAVTKVIMRVRMVAE